jgi:hypothetical protein
VIERLTAEEREQLFQQLIVVVPRLSGGRYQMVAARRLKVLQGLAKVFMSRRPDLIPAQLQELVRDSLELVDTVTRQADSMRAIAAAALDKEERRKRKPDPRTDEILGWVRDRVRAARGAGEKPNWTALAVAVMQEFGKKYQANSLRATYGRFVKSGPRGSGSGA